jgi:O-antigen/teichoic acid export membrane protein
MIVRHAYSAAEAGLYAGLAVVGRVLVFGSAAVSMALFPRFRSAPAAQARRLARGTAAAVLCGGLLAWAVTAAMPTLTLRVLLGGGYGQAAGLLAPYLGGCVLYAIATLLAMFLLARGGGKSLYVVCLIHLVAMVAFPLVGALSLTGLAEAQLLVGASLTLCLVAVVESRHGEHW